MNHLYNYKAIVIRVVDGDTVELMIDLGFYTWRKETIRLARIDAPEPHTKTRLEGLAATDFLRGLIDGRELYVVTIKNDRDGFKRYIAELWLDTLNISDHMVAEGHAIYREY